MRGSSRFVRFLSISVAAVAICAATAAPAGAAGHTQSQNFAGYQTSLAPTSGAVTFKLPALTCDANAAGIVPNITFTNFTTSKFTSGGVYVQCVNGVENYNAFSEINNDFGFQTVTLAAGDTVKIAISAGATSTTVTITDVTSASSISTTKKGAGNGGPFTGASIGDVKIGNTPPPVPVFTTLTFSGWKINGAKVPLGTVFTANDMYNGATLQISSGKLSAAGKFTTTFVHV